MSLIVVVFVVVCFALICFSSFSCRFTLFCKREGVCMACLSTLNFGFAFAFACVQLLQDMNVTENSVRNKEENCSIDRIRCKNQGCTGISCLIVWRVEKEKRGVNELQLWNWMNWMNRRKREEMRLVRMFSSYNSG
ncbi:MAG: hypothetical protein J3R72DRAFT_450092 [Linnemannia gamsii]|nr:MAG: hypothetical protein J3R72DRAFT_450092 [Linnemannia gamsii]